jgi:hypothetical protein
MNPCRALDNPLGLGIARLAEVPAERELAEIGGKAVGRLTVGLAKRALAVPDRGGGQATELAQAAVHAPADVGELLGEDERAGAGPRPAQAGDDDPATPRLAVADRDLGRGLPEVELADLTRPVDGALIGARRAEDRAQLAHVVVEDRL